MMPVRLWAIGYNVPNWNTVVLRSLSSFAAISSGSIGVHPWLKISFRGEDSVAFRHD
jgi:hypothetical protein